MSKQQALQEQTEAEEAARAAGDLELNQFAADHSEQYQAFYEQAKTELFAAHPGMAVFARAHPDSALHDGAIRARVRQLVKQNVSYPKNSDSPEAAPLENLGTTFAAMLQEVIKRPRLKAPRKPAPATPETPEI